jgi:hypothetical protein
MESQAHRSRAMYKYMITITTPSKNKTHSSVILEMAPNGVTASYPKESGIEITPLRDGPRYEFLFKLPNTNEELCLCLETRGMSAPSRELQTGGTSKKFEENYLDVE